MRRRRSSLVAAVLVATLLGVLAPGAAAGAGAAVSGNPFSGAGWFLDRPTLAAAQAADAAQGSTAAALERIAATPQSLWFVASDDPASSGYVRGFFRRADADPGKIVFITLHGLPQQVCAGENAPGASDEAAYRRWIDGYAQLIGSRRAVVFLEPDALAASRCLSAAARRVRFALMTYAARTLSALPGTAVYEDAGAGDWRSVRDAAALLRAAGVRYARGFALNATHYDWTASEVAYGARVSRLVGGKHFVVNTAFNGRGPLVRNHFHVWCNPGGRSLGPLPTTTTGNRLADAFFWTGNPGLSDGHCNGGPNVGTFWESWALELVRDTHGARDFPALTFHNAPTPRLTRRSPPSPPSRTRLAWWHGPPP